MHLAYVGNYITPWSGLSIFMRQLEEKKYRRDIKHEVKGGEFL